MIIEQKLPGGYIPQNERKENREENSTKNPQMEKLKLMSQMMNKRNKQTPVVTVSRKSPSSSSVRVHLFWKKNHKNFEKKS